MSVAAEIWKHPLLRSARTRAKSDPAAIVVARDNAADNPLSSLVRQLFFSGAIQRTRALFVSPGPETDASALAEDAARVLLDITCATVAIVDSRATSLPCDSPKKPQGAVDLRSSCSQGFQIGDHLWRIPADQLAQTSAARGHLSSDHLPFDYSLFAGSVTESLFALLCSYCDAAVLVLTASETRRESAMQAKRILQQHGVELLGTVLEGRRFPIPEAIYRRL